MSCSYWIHLTLGRTMMKKMVYCLGKMKNYFLVSGNLIKRQKEINYVTPRNH